MQLTANRRTIQLCMVSSFPSAVAQVLARRRSLHFGQMLARLLTGGLIVVLLLAGCRRSPEPMLVGTWKVQGGETAGVWIYRPDHTLEFKGHDELGPVSASGTWRVEGRQLTFNLGASERHTGVADTTITILSLNATQLQLQTSEETVVTLNRTK